MRHVIVTGAAGFVGSHLVDRLLDQGLAVTGIDNFTRGVRANLSQAVGHAGFTFIEADLADLPAVERALPLQQEYEAVWHLAANSDIAAGVATPDVDLRDTFLTTYNTLALMRERRIPVMLFASTSAIYGAHPGVLTEDTGPLHPVSNYGAMKLASEGLISAALESHLERAYVFRFPNVVGPRATHGVIFDLLAKLATRPPELEVLGDGRQQKPYLHVSQLLEAMAFVLERSPDRLSCFNIGPEDDGATVRFIAETVVHVAAPGTPIRYGGGSRGWVGDVPRFTYSSAKLAQLGWRPAFGSEDAVVRAVRELHSVRQM